MNKQGKDLTASQEKHMKPKSKINSCYVMDEGRKGNCERGCIGKRVLRSNKRREEGMTKRK